MIPFNKQHKLCIFNNDDFICHKCQYWIDIDVYYEHDLSKKECKYTDEEVNFVKEILE